MDAEPQPEPTLQSMPLVIDTKYRVYPGESVEPTSEDAEIEVRHEVLNDARYVTLLAGEANLLQLVNE